MEIRENCIVALHNIVKTNAVALGLKRIDRNPSVPVTDVQIPCLFIIEGVDIIKEKSKRNNLGYPAKRQLELTFEIVADATTNIKTLYRNLRDYLLTDTSPVDDSYIEEVRTEGPFSYGIPKLLGMRLIISVYYIDNGV